MEYRPSKSDRILAMLIPLSGLFSTFLIPLIIWLSKHDESSLIDFYGRQFFNFLINMILLPIIIVLVATGLTIASALSIIFIPFIAMVWVGFGIFSAFFGVFCLIVILCAAVKAYKGKFYSYPVPFTFIKSSKEYRS